MAIKNQAGFGMTDTDLLDIIDEIHQVPYPSFSAVSDKTCSWASRFEGWRITDPTDQSLYPTIRDAIMAMVKP